MKGRLSFQALNKQKLVEDVVNQLQTQISSGNLQIGEKIPTEPELMKLLGVGRSTIREAVNVLVHAGLLEKKQGYGTFLTSKTTIQEPLTSRLHRAELMEIYEVRRMLEVETARLACSRRDEDDLIRMRQCLNESQAALRRGDRQHYIKSDVEFHLAIALASKNSVMIDLYRTFSEVLQDMLLKLEREFSPDDPYLYYHEQIYMAVKDRDEEAAVKWTLSAIEAALQ